MCVCGCVSLLCVCSLPVHIQTRCPIGTEVAAHARLETCSVFLSASVRHHAAPTFQPCSSRILAIFCEIFNNLIPTLRTVECYKRFLRVVWWPKWNSSQVECMRQQGSSRHLPECLWIPSGPWASRLPGLPASSFAPPLWSGPQDEGLWCWVSTAKATSGWGGRVGGHRMALQIGYQKQSGIHVLWQKKREVVLEWSPSDGFQIEFIVADVGLSLTKMTL